MLKYFPESGHLGSFFFFFFWSFEAICGKNTRLQLRNLVIPLINCLTLDKQFNISKPQVSYFLVSHNKVIK